MRLVVDADRCQGHTMCAAMAPDLVTLDDEDGHARAVVFDFDADSEVLTRAERAVLACPEGAVSIAG